LDTGAVGWGNFGDHRYLASGGACPFNEVEKAYSTMVWLQPPDFECALAHPGCTPELLWYPAPVQSQLLKHQVWIQRIACSVVVAVNCPEILSGVSASN